MLIRRLLPVTFGVLLLAASAARAQEGGTRIGSCNPSKVFLDLDERKAIDDKLVDERKKFTIEVDKKKAELNSIEQDRDQLKPESAAYRDKSDQLLEKSIQFNVWGQLKEAQMLRQGKDYTKSLYDKIRAACKEVALEKKLDLVLAERRPELPPNMDKLTLEQVRGVLSQNDTLYINDKVDITQAVILLMNKKYAAAQAGGPGAGSK
jgi:Skp family chaperone for outer membrane proteins